MARVGLGRLDDAWKDLVSLAERFPRSKSLAATRVRLAEAALAANQPSRAAEQFRLVAGPESAADKAAEALAEKRTEAADVTLRARAFVGLGKALWELSDPRGAARAFAAALQLAPSGTHAAEVALAHGRALEASEQTDAALRAYTSLSQRFPKSDLAPQADLAHARLLAKSGRHADAAREFERLMEDRTALGVLKVVGTTPDRLLDGWGWSLVDAKQPAEADRVFTRLLTEYPESPFAADARFNLAESANLARKYAKVVELLEPVAAAAKPLSRDSVGVPAAQQNEAAQTKDLVPAATDSIQRLLPAVLYRLGRSRLELKEWQAAGATLERLVAEYPDTPYRREAIFFRAEAALQSGDAALALANCTKILKEAPASTDPEGWIPAVRLKQIQCWVALKEWKLSLDAAKELKSSLKPADPCIAELDFATGQSLLGLGRLDEARAAFQSVIDRRGKTDLAAQALVMHGETHFHQDHLHEALRDFLQVDILYNSPRWQAVALLEAGKVYERLDQWANAAETYERLLSRFPDEPTAAEARLRRAGAIPPDGSTPAAKKS
jgi:TolA-binding protein